MSWSEETATSYLTENSNKFLGQRVRVPWLLLGTRYVSGDW